MQMWDRVSDDCCIDVLGREHGHQASRQMSCCDPDRSRLCVRQVRKLVALANLADGGDDALGAAEDGFSRGIVQLGQIGDITSIDDPGRQRLEVFVEQLRSIALLEQLREPDDVRHPLAEAPAVVEGTTVPRR